MRVAVIGLGDIARKAYLPVLSVLPDVALHLVTRNGDVLADLAARYRPDAVSTTVDEAIASGVDAAFVHAATSAHPTIVGALLDAGVPTFVDKPLTDAYATSAALVGQAERSGVSLMVGFNRRHAPAHVAAHAGVRDLVIHQKHRPNLPPEKPRRMVFDDFIHVVDTLRFFAAGPVTTEQIDFGGSDGTVDWISVLLAGEGFSCYGSMHRGSGASEESLEVVGGGRKVRVAELGDVLTYDSSERLSRRPGWESAPETRGFTAMCTQFLDAVRHDVVLSALDALETHALCERVVAAITA
ncbi:Gfo/Idh/MocA family oxidoreductase [Acidothermaceae bacterium B102]|nr:Gfo/Idh/MocA family oxidoreductase [Acidothermaceae bacterium B102]